MVARIEHADLPVGRSADISSAMRRAAQFQKFMRQNPRCPLHQDRRVDQITVRNGQVFALCRECDAAFEKAGMDPTKNDDPVVRGALIKQRLQLLECEDK